MENRKKTEEKIDSFFKAAIAYYGKEIALDSNQYFEIDQIVDREYTKPRFQIQYGYPQSGSVFLKFELDSPNNSVALTDISINAPRKGEPIYMATFAPEYQPLEELSIRFDFGMDMNTEEHNTITSIMDNPNALRILTAATTDLERAEVLGECRLAVPMDSVLIPCTSATKKRRINSSESTK